MAKKTNSKDEAPAEQPDIEEIKATDEERCLAVVLCRPHHKGQPDEAKLAIFNGLSVRRRNAAIERLRKLTPSELKKFKNELEGKTPAEADASTSEAQGGDDGNGSGASAGPGIPGNSGDGGGAGTTGTG